MNRNAQLAAQSEAAEAVTDLRAVYAEIFPHWNPEAMQVDDAQLALAVMLRREIRAASKARLSGREFDRIARRNLTDQE